jgi:hypothetical protein
MAGPSAADLAEHIAAILDGDYDDGLDVYVSASATGNGFHIGLSGDGGERIGAYRVIIEQIE